MGVPLLTQLLTGQTEQPEAHGDAWTLSRSDMQASILLERVRLTELCATQGPPCVQEGGDHAGSLLANLNLQRSRAQFCDCVVRQGRTSDLLYPAHRGVLAASSPVLASILSSAGVLVELQAPGLSDSVLAHVLDYIYTGALPCPQSHQHFDSLLAAASYLEMDDLQKTLEARLSRLQPRRGAPPDRVWADASRCGCSSSPSAAGACVASRTGTELQLQLHSARPADPGGRLQTCPRCQDGGSSPPGPSCGAVPVIRHSSAAAAAASPYRPVSEVSGGFEAPRSDPAPGSGSAEDQTPPQQVHAVLPLPLHLPDAGGASEHGGVCDTEERKEQRGHLSRCRTDTSLHIPEDRDEAALGRQQHDHAANDHAGDAEQLAQRCDPASYHAHLHYRCVPRKPEQTRSDRVDHRDQDGRFSPAEQVLLLDISTKPPELLMSYRYDRRGEWAGLAQDAPGTPRGGQGAETAAGGGGGALTDGHGDVKSADETSEAAGDRVKGQVADYTMRCEPSCVAPASPTSSSPPFAANMPTIMSPQLSHLHPFQCSLCRRSFSQRGSLNRHMRSHLGIRPFPCPRCPMTFSRQYRVSEHMRVHQRCVLRDDFEKPLS